MRIWLGRLPLLAIWKLAAGTISFSTVERRLVTQNLFTLKQGQTQNAKIAEGWDQLPIFIPQPFCRLML
jgi:hypothetical protein